MRFDPDTECQQAVAWHVLKWLCSSDKCIDVSSVRHIGDMAGLFRGSGLAVTLFAPMFAYAAPWNWPQLIAVETWRFRSRIHSGDIPTSKCALVYYLTPSQLYGIHENWVHCVGELLEEGTRKTYVDSFEEMLQHENRASCFSELKPSLNLRRMISPKLLVRPPLQ